MTGAERGARGDFELDPPFDTPDPFWASNSGSGEGGRLSQEDLATVAAAWPRPSSAPPEVAWSLSVARSLWVQAWWRRDFLVVAITWSFMALEGSLRAAAGDAVHPNGRMPDVLEALAEQGTLDSDEALMLGEVFQRFRNPLAHGRRELSLTLGGAEPFLARAHETAARLFP